MEIVACWALALVSGALIVAWATTMRIVRCPDGWSNLGSARWGLVIVVLILEAPTLGYAAWLAFRRDVTAPLRRAALAIGILAPLVTIVFAFEALPAATSTCLD